jgi:DUF4097 and DUF4098 domain-containing protein YvlB
MQRSTYLFPSILLLAGSLSAQTFTTGPCNGDEGNTNKNSWFGGRMKVCEVRRTTLPLVNGKVDVKGTNGGIEVIGEDRSDIALEARVTAQASGRDEAEALLRKVTIGTNGRIEAKGPTFSGFSHETWSVNYRLRVPRHVSARLETQNGGIDLSNLEGKINAQTTNGGLTLTRLAGDVNASTVNGGLDVTLDGRQWRGAGLVARSTNGGVSVKAPDHYSAHLIAETVNGGISVGFPIPVQGEIRKHLDTNLGNGGPTVEFETVNGGVSVDRD